MVNKLENNYTMKNKIHLAGILRRLPNILSISLLVFILAACQSSGINRLTSTGENRALELAYDARHEEAAIIYMSLANDANRIEKKRLRLLAIEQWLDAGNLIEAEKVNIDIEPPTSGALVLIWKTNLATFNLYQGNADEALKILTPMSKESLPLRDRLRVEMLRADAWTQKKDLIQAVFLLLCQSRPCR